MKTTQVQIILEEFFGGKIYWEFKNNAFEPKQICLKNEVEKIMSSKFDTPDWHKIGTILMPHESRETIIQALWEYQKSLLPKNWLMKHKVCDYHSIKERGEILFNSDVFKKTYRYDESYDFYDPETRIITITKFEDK